jgi:hypothetical protein
MDSAFLAAAAQEAATVDAVLPMAVTGERKVIAADRMLSSTMRGTFGQRLHLRCWSDFFQYTVDNEL